MSLSASSRDDSDLAHLMSDEETPIPSPNMKASSAPSTLSPGSKPLPSALSSNNKDEEKKKNNQKQQQKEGGENSNSGNSNKEQSTEGEGEEEFDSEGNPIKKGIREARSSKDSESCEGVLPTGKRFRVPETVSVMEQLTNPRVLSNPSILFWMFTNIFSICLYLLWHFEIVGTWFFSLQFIFWRLMYNIGIGLLLRWQSNERWLDKMVKKHILDIPSRKAMFEKGVVLGKHEKKSFRVDDYPIEFSSWMAFRFVAMTILAQDVVGYALVLFVHAPVSTHWPNFTSPDGIARWVVSVVLTGFAFWSKSDAHRVIGDYAWYWGDFFFLLDKSLVFDGVFQMFPHPMYTIGYLFMYGASVITLSYPVFYLSVFGHCCQLAFLVLFENPHIDKTYNTFREPSEFERRRDEILYGKKAAAAKPATKQNSKQAEEEEDEEEERTGDGYFAGKDKELVMLLNFNPRRAGDLLLVIMIAYTAFVALSPFVPVYVAIAQYIFWRVVHNVGLGLVMRKQSQSGWWTKKFKTAREAFDNWKPIYNAIVTLTWVSFIVCALRLFEWECPFPPDWKHDFNLRVFSCVVGTILVALNVYVSSGVYEAIGEFGYFYGDFFIDDVPSRLTYDGIYRYMNNPDSSLGFLAAYGAALITGSWIVFALSIGSHLLVKGFQYLVEEPHMESRYGKQEMRKLGGFGKGIVQSAKNLRHSLIERRRKVGRVIDDLKRQLEDGKTQYNTYIDELRSSRGQEKRRTSQKAAAAKKGGEEETKKQK